MTPAAPHALRVPLGGERWANLANVAIFGEVRSTNDVARALVERMIAEDSEILPTAIVARRQTAGKGRQGRSWESSGVRPLAVSLIVPWPEGPDRVKVPMSWGVRIARGLAAGFGVDVRLKWPNDLLCGRRKVGGLLAEARSGPEGSAYVVVGLGLNVDASREELDKAGLTGATSLAAEGAAAERLEGEAPLRALLAILDAGLAEEIEDLPAAFDSVSAHRPGDRIAVHDGSTVVAGAYAGVTPEGFLRLASGEGVEVVLSGDVTLF